MNLSTQTANQRYKAERQAGQTNLDFKTWLQRQKSRNFLDVTGSGTVPVNPTLNSPIQDVLSEINQEAGLQTTLDSRYTFGVSNTVWLWSGIGIAVLVSTVIIVHQLRKK